jgi:hypothetical protein
MKIPSFPNYNITLYGKVTSLSTGDVVNEFRRNRAKSRSIVLYRKGKKTTQSLARLMLQTFRPLKEGLSSDWLSVKYLNGDKDNIHATNLEWTDELYHPSIIPGVTHPLDIWVPIPEFNLEVCLADGIKFRNIKTHNLWKTSIGSSGYAYVATTYHGHLDVHRLLAKAFLVHPLDVDHLTVNHKDSDKLNNSLDNLEWVTQTENLEHSQNEGKRVSRVRKVMLHELDTCITTGYPSINHAARFLDCNPGHVHSLCTHRQRRGLGYKGFLVKYADDITPFSEMKKDIAKNQEPYRIAVKNMISGEVTVYDSLMKTVKGENINPKTIYRLLWNELLVPWNYRCLQTYKEDMIWPNYPREVVDIFSRVRNGGRPLKVHHPDGDVEYSAGVTEWLSMHPEIKTPVAVLSRALGKDGGTHRGIRFEYIDLKDYQ